MAEVMRDMPGASGTPLPGDWLATGIFTFIIPVVVGFVLVYVLTMIKPDAVLSPDQMVEYKRLEKERELEKRGVKKKGPGEESRAARRKKLRSKLRGRKSGRDDEDDEP